MTSPPAGEFPRPRRESDRQQAKVLTRRGFFAAVATAIGSALLIGVLWLLARDAPSSGRDPNLTPPESVPARTPTPTAKPGHPTLS